MIDFLIQSNLIQFIDLKVRPSPSPVFWQSKLEATKESSLTDLICLLCNMSFSSTRALMRMLYFAEPQVQEKLVLF